MNKLTFNKRTQSDIDLESCSQHGDLSVLNLSSSMVLGYGFEYLHDNPSLSEIYLRNTPIKSQYLKTLSELPMLALVDISDTGIDDDGLQALASIKGLKVLIADRVMSLTDSALDGFNQAPCAGSLQKLSLTSTAIGDSAVAVIGQLKALKILLLAGTRLTTSGALELAKLSQLEHLTLSDTQVGDEAMAALAGLSTLQTLHLSGTPVSPLGLKQLAPAPSLTSLSLSLAYGDGIVEALSGFKKMETIRLFDGRIDTGMAALHGVDTLRSLELEYVNLSSQAVSALKQLKQLELLVMDQEHSPLEKEMHQALPACMIRFED